MAICAFAIIHKKEEILLVRIAPPFAESGKWNFPGGVIEYNEEIKTGLTREVFEETGISCLVDGIRDSFMTSNPDNDITIFNSTYVEGDILAQEEEILEAKWFTVAEALDLELAFSIREYLTP